MSHQMAAADNVCLHGRHVWCDQFRMWMAFWSATAYHIPALPIRPERHFNTGRDETFGFHVLHVRSARSIASIMCPVPTACLPQVVQAEQSMTTLQTRFI